jgi:hypothetical protein
VILIHISIWIYFLNCYNILEHTYIIHTFWNCCVIYIYQRCVAKSVKYIFWAWNILSSFFKFTIFLLCKLIPVPVPVMSIYLELLHLCRSDIIIVHYVIMVHWKNFTDFFILQLFYILIIAALVELVPLLSQNNIHEMVLFFQYSQSQTLLKSRSDIQILLMSIFYLCNYQLYLAVACFNRTYSKKVCK